MARLVGPDANSRLAYAVTGRAFRPGAVATVYLDEDGTELADIREYDGTDTPGDPIPGSTVTADDNALFPKFWFPDGVDTLWLSADGGPLTQVEADQNTQVAAVNAAVAAVTTQLNTAVDTMSASVADVTASVAGKLNAPTAPSAGALVTMGPDGTVGTLTQVAYWAEKGDWAPNVFYQVNSIVRYTSSSGSRYYRCSTAHTSGESLDFAKFVSVAIQETTADSRYLVRPWAAATQYVANQLVTHVDADGNLLLYRANAAHLSGATWSDATWDLLTPPAATGGGGTGSPLVPPNPQATNYVLALADGGAAVEVTATTDTSVTVPHQSIAALPVGSVVEVLARNTGQVSLAPGAGVTLRGAGSGTLRTQFSSARMRLSAPGEWMVSGDFDTSTPAPTTSTINFGSTIGTIDALHSFGICVTGYTGDAGDIRNTGVIRDQTTALAPGLFRLGIKWDRVNGQPLNGANGGVGLSDDWVAGINAAKPTGANILAILEGDVGAVPENGCTPSDAAAIVHWYNDGGGQHGGPIKYWIVGNEPDLVGTTKLGPDGQDLHDGRTYGAYWWTIHDAVKAADPTALVGGPAASALSGHIETTVANATSPGSIGQFWNDFLQVTNGSGQKIADVIDFVDWHFYATGTFAESSATVLGYAVLPNASINSLRAVINAYSPGRGDTMPIIVSEFNWAYKPDDQRNDVLDDFGAKNDGRFMMAENTVFTAAYVLNYLRAGGWGTFFGDVVGPLGLFCRNNLGDNMARFDGTHHYPHGKPAGTAYAGYFGLGMWTGMGLFRRFGSTIVSVTGSATNMQIYAASVGANQGDVMIVNRDVAATRNLTFTLTGIANGTPVQLWSTDRFAPWDPPKQRATYTVTSGGITGVIVPPLTVARLVVGP